MISSLLFALAATFVTQQLVHPASLADSVGIGTHIDAHAQIWADSASVFAKLNYLGVHNVRDGCPSHDALEIFTRLALTGIRFDLFQSSMYDAESTGHADATLDVWRAHSLLRAVPGSVITLEGANEYNSHHFILYGKDSYGDVDWGIANASALKRAHDADKPMNNVRLIAPSSVDLAFLPRFGGDINISNAHVYGSAGEQLQDRIIAAAGYAQASAPGRPVFLTEVGISSAGYGSPTFSSADENDQATIIVNAVLDGFRAGAEMIFIYELFDEPALENINERHYGMFRSDGTPKPAAIAIRNLIHIAGQGRLLPPRIAQHLALKGLPPTASAMLLGNPDGSRNLIIWNGRAQLFDGKKKLAVDQARIEIHSDRPIRGLRMYELSNTMVAHLRSRDTRSLQLILSRNPLIISYK